MQAWRLTLAWSGAAYVGWQLQPEGRSLQGVVEAALSRALGGEPVRVTASGRTDAGVHALGQVVSFCAETPRQPRALLNALNQILPRDIAALDAAIMPDDFRVRAWVKRKLYRYRVLNRGPRCPFRDGFVWHWRGPIHVEPMANAAATLLGRHDFTSFRAQGCGARHPVRTIERAEVFAAPDGEIHLEFVGNGFLRHQVRIMAGTLLEIGMGRRHADDMPRVLEARDRLQAGQTAPAQGLWLVWVELGDGPRLAQNAAHPGGARNAPEALELTENGDEGAEDDG